MVILIQELKKIQQQEEQARFQTTRSSRYPWQRDWGVTHEPQGIMKFVRFLYDE